MTVPTLVIGNRNYSSWSLRPWVAMKVHGIEFVEQRIALSEPGTREQILRQSPSGKVPCLLDGDLRIWDTLAILEYLAESTPSLWPAARASRAHARSISAEMHSGFVKLRQLMPMNVRKRHPDKGRTAEVLADIARVTGIWEECLARAPQGGPFLFGPFTAADAMYAPVMFRFRTYGVELSARCAAYADAVLALPAMREWIAAAEAETESIVEVERMYGE